MFRKLGPVGIGGSVLVLVGVVLVALESLQIAVGIALVLLGLAVVVRAVVSSVLGAWGMM